MTVPRLRGRPALAVDFGLTATTVAAATRFGPGGRLLEIVSVGPDPKDLARLVHDRRWRGAAARVVVQNGGLLWRPITAPRLGRRHTASLVELEIGRAAADGAPRHWSYRVEQSGEAPGYGQRLLLAAAARTEQVEDLAGRVRAAGLQPAGVIPFPEAIRALASSSPGDVTAFIDFGAAGSRVVITAAGEPHLFRELSVGGDDLTAELGTIMQPGRPALRLEPAEAEAVKRRHGLRHDPDSPEYDADIPLGAVTAALKPLLERFVRELYGTFDYWNERYPGAPIGGVRLLGAGSLLPGLEEYLTAVLGVPARPVAPENAAGCDAALLAGGAPALGAIAAGAPVLDLAPPRPTGALEAIGRRVTWGAVAAALLLYTGFGAGWSLIRLQRDGVAAARWQARLASGEHRAALLQEATAQDAALARAAEIRAALRAGVPDWSAILAGLSAQVGDEARLLTLSLEHPPSPAPGEAPPPSELTLKGRIVGEAAAEPAVARLLVDLAAVPGLGPATLVRTGADAGGRMSFEVRSPLRPGGGR